MGYAAIYPSANTRPAKHTSPRKTASGEFFTKPNKTSLENRANSLKLRQGNRPTPTKTASGVFYYGYRYYDPSVGRWLNRDPIAEVGGLNLYGLVDNDPISQFDILGLVPWHDVGPGTDANLLDSLSELFCDDDCAALEEEHEELMEALCEVQRLTLELRVRQKQMQLALVTGKIDSQHYAQAKAKLNELNRKLHDDQATNRSQAEQEILENEMREKGCTISSCPGQDELGEKLGSVEQALKKALNGRRFKDFIKGGRGTK